MKEFGISDEEIEIEQNQSFTITLESNPTSGFRWEVNYDDKLLELVRRKFHQLSEDIGSGGCEKFQFKGHSPGKTRVEMRYKREWEEKILNKKSFMVKIK